MNIEYKEGAFVRHKLRPEKKFLVLSSVGLGFTHVPKTRVRIENLWGNLIENYFDTAELEPWRDLQPPTFHQPTPTPTPEIDWLDVLVNILKCFSVNEGTWFEPDWEEYGVTPEQQKLINKAWEKKYGQKYSL